MSRGMPSMIALLGLLAVAGYQNRDKIAEVLGGGKQEPGSGPGQNNQQGVQDGVLGRLGGLLGGGKAPTTLVTLTPAAADPGQIARTAGAGQSVTIATPTTSRGSAS